MTVKEYLSMNKGIESVGIYGEEGSGLAVHADAITILPYVESEVKEVNLGIFDETRKTIYGDSYNAKYIRACIHIKEKE